MKINPNLVNIYKKDTIEPSKIQQEYIKWFDSYTVNPLLSYFTLQDIAYLNKLAMSPALNCNVKEKYRLIGELMKSRGFRLIGGGTNRRAYECIHDERVVAKVATDQVGFTSNLRELVNQNVLKPFCCKVFEVSPCGTLALIEKIIPIKSVEEFQKYSQDIYDILYFKIRNNDIGMEDIGTRSMKNWGYRNGFGPVLLDYPTMYVLDPIKRFCRNIVNSQMCGGTLDYDEGFNVIVCSECGRTHFARTLAKKDGEDISKLLQAVGYQQKRIEKEQFSMRVKLVNLETGEYEVREVGGKSNYVDPNRRKNPRQVINLNEPQTNNNKRKHDVRFKDVVLGTLNPETGVIENTPVVVPEIKHEVIVTEPVITTEEIYVSVIEDEIERLVDKDNNLSVEEVIKTFDKFIVDTTINYEGGDTNDVMNILSIINNNAIGKVIIPHEKAKSMYKELSVATLDLDENELNSVNDNSISYNDNTMIARLVNRIYGSTDNFAAFYYLVNTVKNTASFFESVIGFFKTVIEHFSYYKDNSEVGKDYHYIYKDVYDVARKAIAYVFDDYIYNVTFSGNLEYNRNNAFVSLKNCLEEMSKSFNNDDKASESTDKTKSVQLFRSYDYAELCYFEDEVNDEETEEEDTTENILEEKETEEEIHQNEDEVSEEDSEETVEDNMDVVSDSDSSDNVDDTVTEDIPVKKPMILPTNTAGMFDGYNRQMSRKQRRKFEKGNKKKRK